jgi:hypothetical protein
MDASQQQRAINHLQAKWRNPVCPIDGANSWTISDVVELRPFTGGGLIIGAGPLFPFFQVTCNECGYTVLFNAVVAGLVPGATEANPAMAQAQAHDPAVQHTEGTE